MQTSPPGTKVVPKIDSVSRKASGSSNNYSRSNYGGNKSSGGSKGGGGSSGGSGKLSTKDPRKTSESSRDRYHDVNIQL
jgi:hypothetical protein